MPNAYETVQASVRGQMLEACRAGEVKTVRVKYSIDTTNNQLGAVNNTIRFLKLPPNHVPVDGLVDCDDLDANGAPTLLFDFGLDIDTDCFLDNSAIGQAGGLARFDKKAGFRIGDSNDVRYVMLTVVTPAATNAVGDIYVTFSYRAVANDD